MEKISDQKFRGIYIYKIYSSCFQLGDKYVFSLLQVTTCNKYIFAYLIFFNIKSDITYILLYKYFLFFKNKTYATEIFVSHDNQNNIRTKIQVIFCSSNTKHIQQKYFPPMITKIIFGPKFRLNFKIC